MQALQPSVTSELGIGDWVSSWSPKIVESGCAVKWQCIFRHLGVNQCYSCSYRQRDCMLY